MDKFLEESLRSASERNASTVQWSLIVLSMLLLAHLLFFTRFLHVREDMQSADEQERLLATLDENASRLANAHAELNDLVAQETSRITKTEIVERTVQAFRVLNMRVAPMLDAKRLGLPAPPTLPSLPGSMIPISQPLGAGVSDLRGEGAPRPGPPGIGTLRPEVLQNDQPDLPRIDLLPAIQLPPEAIASGQPPVPFGPAFTESSLELPKFDEALEQTLRNAANLSEVRNSLGHYVKQHITEPSFAAANIQIQNLIRNRVLPRLTEDLAQVKELQIQNAELAKKRSADAASSWPDWPKMINMIQETIDHAKRVKFETPADDRWWRTVSEKEHTASVLAVDATFSMRPDVGPDLDRLSGMLHLVRTDQQRARQQLEKQMKSVEQTFAQFQQSAKSLDASLSVAFLDLESFVLGFPLIVAVAFSTVVIATTQRLRTVKIIHGLMSQSVPQAESWKQVLGLAGLHGRSLRSSSLAIGAAGVVWIVIILVQLYSHVGWTSSDMATVMMSLGMVIGACIVRFRMLAAS